MQTLQGQILISGKRIEKFKNDELFKGNLAMLPQDPRAFFVKKKTVGEDLEEMLVSGATGIRLTKWRIYVIYPTCWTAIHMIFQEENSRGRHLQRCCSQNRRYCCWMNLPRELITF